jgi:hypothetical protein
MLSAEPFTISRVFQVCERDDLQMIVGTEFKPQKAFQVCFKFRPPQGLPKT